MVNQPVDRTTRLRDYARYFQNNLWKGQTYARFAPELIRVAREFKYLHWPRRLKPLVKRRDVLDIGCGMGLHGVGFVLSGVRSYTGVDPVIDLESDVVKHAARGRPERCGWTPRRMMEQWPQLLYIAGSFDDLPAGRLWDVAVLHNTTEHLLDLPSAFARIAHLLRPSGRLIFSHHNFYSWNGHHRAPKTVMAIDRGDPEQRKVVDWGHLAPDADLRTFLAGHVNAITLDELRRVTEQLFAVEHWQENRTPESLGGNRLTVDILQQYPHLTRRDLETQSVYCVARLL